MKPEQRKEIRSIFTRQPKGRLHVLLGERSIDVFAVKDVSPLGVRLEVGTQVDIGENIRIRYLTEEIDLKLNGVVIWNSASVEATPDVEVPDACIIGIKLGSPSLLQAFW